MKKLLVLIFVSATVAHALVARIPPDEAAKHLLKAPEAKYPEVAETARIQGNVILEVRIDESGAASVTRLVSGHPMLAPAAIAAVNQWRYQPFQVNAAPAAIKTFVMVTFGNPSNQNPESRAEMAFQDKFWTTEDIAEAAISGGDFDRSEEQLKSAGTLVSQDKEMRHMHERWQWTTTMGRLRIAQHRYDEAEKYFKDALSLRQNKWEEKDSPEVGSSLANLAAVFAEEKKFEDARSSSEHSLTIFQKTFRKVDSRNAGARQAYGRAAAQESWLLVRVAKERNDTADMEKQCHVLARLLCVSQRNRTAVRRLGLADPRC